MAWLGFAAIAVVIFLSFIVVTKAHQHFRDKEVSRQVRVRIAKARGESVEDKDKEAGLDAREVAWFFGALALLCIVGTFYASYDMLRLGFGWEGISAFVGVALAWAHLRRASARIPYPRVIRIRRR